MPDLAQAKQSAISLVYPRPLKDIVKPSMPGYERSTQGLDAVLYPGEYPEAVLFGEFRVDGTTGAIPFGGLWATNERLLFLGFQGLSQRTRVVNDYSYELLTGLEIREGSTFSMPKIVLRLAGTQLEFFFHKGANVEKYADLLRSKSSFGFGRRQAPATDDGDMLSKLERLAALRERGALTEEEFTMAKKALLSL